MTAPAPTWPADKDGLENLPDGGIIFHVGGKAYRADKATTADLAGDYAAVEEHLTRDRKGPIEAILPEIEKLSHNPKLQKEFLDRAYDDLKRGHTQKQLSIHEVSAWMDTLPGVIFTFGRLLRRRHPEVNDGDVLEILTKVGRARVEQAQNALVSEAATRLGARLPEPASADIRVVP